LSFENEKEKKKTPIHVLSRNYSVCRRVQLHVLYIYFCKQAGTIREVVFRGRVSVRLFFFHYKLRIPPRLAWGRLGKSVKRARRRIYLYHTCIIVIIIIIRLCGPNRSKFVPAAAERTIVLKNYISSFHVDHIHIYIYLLL